MAHTGILIHRKLPPAPPPPKEVCHASITIHRHQISDSEKNILQRVTIFFISILYFSFRMISQLCSYHNFLAFPSAFWSAPLLWSFFLFYPELCLAKDYVFDGKWERKTYLQNCTTVIYSCPIHFSSNQLQKACIVWNVMASCIADQMPVNSWTSTIWLSIL